MIVLALIAFLVFLLVSAGALFLFFRVLLLVVKAVFALSLGAGLGVLASLVADACGIDGSSIGVAVGLLSTAGAIAILHRSDRRTRSPAVRPVFDAEIQPSSTKSPARPPPLIETGLADKMESVTQAMREAAATHSLDTTFIEWNEVLGRVPELIAETKALYQGVSKEEQVTLRKQLADDLGSIIDEAERRLSTVRRERHAIFRRWVAIRMGRD